MDKQYDVVVVGAGNGGLSAAAYLAKAGKKVLVSGDVYIPEDVDGRRAADKKFGWIHPCCSYPLSDVTLDVPVIG